MFDPVRGLLDKKLSEEHLQSSNDSMKKRRKKTGRKRLGIENDFRYDLARDQAVELRNSSGDGLVT